MRKDVIDAFILGARRWAEASNSYVAASTDLATSLRDFADEVEADPILANGLSVSVAEITAHADALEEKVEENRDAFLGMRDLVRRIDELEDYKDETSTG